MHFKTVAKAPILNLSRKKSCVPLLKKKVKNNSLRQHLCLVARFLLLSPKSRNSVKLQTIL